jgi:IPT/TIG domain/Ankyrin repeats (3 copies)
MTRLDQTQSSSAHPSRHRTNPYASPYFPYQRTQSLESIPALSSANPHSPAPNWLFTQQQTGLPVSASGNASPPVVPFSVNPHSISLDFPHSGSNSTTVSNVASPEESPVTNMGDFSHAFSPRLSNAINIPSDVQTTRRSSNVSSNRSRPPVIARIVPAEGPISGGIDVTIIGEGFKDGYIAQFGHSFAIPTEFYSSTTLVCKLPPCPMPGPVAVTIRDSALPEIESLTDDPSLFTYVNNTDRALMELALQIMGYKWLGQVEDAKNVAAMIIGNSNNPPLQTPDGSTRGSAELERTVLKCLSLIDHDLSHHPAKLSLRSKTGHTLLHLAAMAGMTALVTGLLVRGVTPKIQDGSGFTPLHFAAWFGHVSVVHALLSVENPRFLLAMQTLEGKTAILLALNTGRREISELLDNHWQSTSSRDNSYGSLVSLCESLSVLSLEEYFAGSELDDSNYGQSNPNSDDEVNDEDPALWLGSLRPKQEQPITDLGDGVVVPQAAHKRFFGLPRPQLPHFPHRLPLRYPQIPRPHFPHLRYPQFPDPQTLNPSLYVAALNEMLQPCLQAMGLRHPDSKLPSAPSSKLFSSSSDEKTYDLPPPAYSELYPALALKKQFSLGTRLSLRGRSFLGWIGMAGDAGLSTEEIEILRSEDGHRKAWTRDYMLMFFWVFLPV